MNAAHTATPGWHAIRQSREGGDCAISYYAPQSASGQPIKTGRHYVPALRLIHVFDENGLKSKFVSLYGGLNGALALLDVVLGAQVERPLPDVRRRSVYELPRRVLRPATASNSAWPFAAAGAA